MTIINFDKVEGGSEVSSRVYLFSQVFHKNVKEELDNVGVKLSDSLIKDVC